MLLPDVKYSCNISTTEKKKESHGFTFKIWSWNALSTDAKIPLSHVAHRIMEYSNIACRVNK